jgi:hypothetical protein
MLFKAGDIFSHKPLKTIEDFRSLMSKAEFHEEEFNPEMQELWRIMKSFDPTTIYESLKGSKKWKSE